MFYFAWPSQRKRPLWENGVLPGLMAMQRFAEYCSRRKKSQTSSGEALSTWGEPLHASLWDMNYESTKPAILVRIYTGSTKVRLLFAKTHFCVVLLLKGLSCCPLVCLDLISKEGTHMIALFLTVLQSIATLLFEKLALMSNL